MSAALETHLSTSRQCVSCGETLRVDLTVCLVCGHAENADVGHKLIAIDNELNRWASIRGCMAGFFRFAWILRALGR